MVELKRVLIAMTLAVAIPLIGMAQVSNVQVSQEGKTIVITYDLNERSHVTPFVSYPNKWTKLKDVSGDVGIVSSGKGKKIVWDVLASYDDKLIVSDVQFKVEAKVSMKTFIMLEGAYSFVNPQYSGGLMFGMVRKVGWYAKFRSSFCFKNADYKLPYADASKSLFFNGERLRPELVADAGVVVRLGCPVYAYAGAGYGYRNLIWKTMSGYNVQINDYSFSGVSAEMGVIGNIKGFTLSLGVNTIAFKYAELQFGIGCLF